MNAFPTLSQTETLAPSDFPTVSSEIFADKLARAIDTAKFFRVPVTIEQVRGANLLAIRTSEASCAPLDRPLVEVSPEGIVSYARQAVVA